MAQGLYVRVANTQSVRIRKLHGKFARNFYRALRAWCPEDTGALRASLTLSPQARSIKMLFYGFIQNSGYNGPKNAGWIENAADEAIRKTNF